MQLDDSKQTIKVNEAMKDNLNTKLSETKNKLKVNPELDDKYIVDAIYTIRQIKQKRHQINKEDESRNNLYKQLNDFDSRVSEEVSGLGIHYNKTSVFHEAAQLASKLSKDESRYYSL